MTDTPLDLGSIRARLEDYARHPRRYADASFIMYAADKREEQLVADVRALVAEVEAHRTRRDARRGGR